MNPEDKARAEVAALQADFETEIEYASAALARRMDLLAWTLRQATVPTRLADPNNWPAVWVMDWPETRPIALADPLIFDLARHQLAHDLRHEPERVQSFSQENSLLELAALLLETGRPSPKGLPTGRVAARMLLRGLDRELDNWPSLWKLRTRNRQDMWVSDFPAVNAIAEAIAERLNLHPMLVDSPASVLSVEAIRSILTSERRKA